MAKLTLVLSDRQGPQLAETCFQYPYGTKTLTKRAVRGLDTGAYGKEYGCFKWTRAVQATTVFLIKWAAWGRRAATDPDVAHPVTEGRRHTLAASLNDAVTKKPDWLKEMFGSDAHGNPEIGFIRRSNPDFSVVKNGPVKISLDCDLLPAAHINVFVRDEPVEDPATLDLLASRIIANCFPEEAQETPKISTEDGLRDDRTSPSSQIPHASDMGSSLQDQAALTREVRLYLNALADECGRLPPYFPPHLQSDDSGKTRFDDLTQTVRLVTDRRQLDQWLARQREQMARQGLDPDSIAYGPRRSMPEQDGERDAETEIETIDWDERASRRFRRAVILGDPGFGKTWLLRHEARRLALKAVKELEDGKSLEMIRLPIFCRLSDLASSDQPLHDSILECLRQEHEQRADATTFWRFVREKLETDDCVLLLDAWDEVPEKLRLQERIEAFVRTFPQPEILLTSRIVGYETMLPPLPDPREFEVAAFDWRKIKAFVQVWFGQGTQEGRTFLAKLESNHRMRGLARIPLMLSLICRACPEGEFSQRRSELYEVCLKGLIRDWVLYDRKSGVKDIELDSAYVEILLKRLGLLSLELLRQGCEQFTLMQLVEILGRWYDEEKVLVVLRLLKHRGILVPANSRGDSPLLFIHRTFQEYLAARSLASDSNAIKTAQARLYDPEWREVLTLLGGLLGGRTRSYLATLLLADANDLLLHRPLLLFLDAATEAGKEHLPEAFLDEMAKLIGDIYFTGECPAGVTPARFVPLLGDRIAETSIRHLKDNHPEIRLRAINALAEIGSQQAVHHLMDALYRESHWLSDSAARALANIGSPAATMALVKALKHGSPRGLEDEFTSYGDNPSEVALPSHSVVLDKGRNRYIRSYAADALGRIGSEQAVEALGQALKDEDPYVRQNAADALGGIGSEQAVEALRQALKEENSFVRCSAVKALGCVGSEQVIDILVQTLADENRHVRRSAVLALGEVGSEQAVEALVHALNDEDKGVRISVGDALAEIGSQKAIEALFESLKDSEALVRWCGALALGKAGSEQPVAALMQALCSDDAGLRMCAADALGEIGSGQAIEGLMQALKDENRDVRASAALALGKTGSEQVVEIFTQALSGEDVGLRICAGDALGEIGSEQAVEVLMRALKDKNGDVRKSAALALGKLGCDQTAEAIGEALKDEDVGVRNHAAEALGRIGSERAVEALTDALRDNDEGVRRRATEALGQIGSEQAVEALLYALKDNGMLVRCRAAAALGRIGSEEAVKALTHALGDEDMSVGTCAARALGQIGSGQAVEALVYAVTHDDRYVRAIRSSAAEAILHARGRRPVSVSDKSCSTNIRRELRLLKQSLECLAHTLEPGAGSGG